MAGYRVIDQDGVEFKKRKYRVGESFEANAEEVADFRYKLEKIPESKPVLDLGGGEEAAKE